MGVLDSIQGLGTGAFVVLEHKATNQHENAAKVPQGQTILRTEQPCGCFNVKNFVKEHQ